jgi:hypothetical protein
MLKKIVLILLCLSSVQLINAQKGKVTGKVIDGEYNDVLAFASIYVKGTDKGTTSDFDGLYTLDLDEGEYTLVFSFIGYETKEITSVVIKSKAVVELNVTLNASVLLDEVLITTSARQNTEQAVLNYQKQSATLMDGLSASSINKTGASNIASAIKSVPGVSVQDGKFVYVRGLGDRYTKSILNGMDIPGLDPDKNTIQMNIFPTNILENILVVKSASAELPADFTGGVVDIVTKDFPTQKQMQISVSGGFNPSMHFKDNYLTYDGSKSDFLGFDSGARKLPISTLQVIPNPASSSGNRILESITRAFSPTLATETTTSMPDFSIGFNYGNQFDIKNNKLGFIASIDYKNSTTFYEGFENGIYQKPEERDQYELLFDRRQSGNIGSNNVLASILTGFSYKTAYSKYTLNLLHIQNGESRAALFDQKTEISNAIDVVKDNLEYTQRSISNVLLAGKTTSQDASFTTEWKVSPTYSRVNDKDVRLTTFIDGPSGYTISSDAGFPTRIWRDLEEINAVGKVDFTKKYDLFSKKAVFKFGGLYSYKQRDFAIYSYEVAFRGISPTIFEGNPDAILADENIWTRSSGTGSYIRGNFEPANSFDSNQNTAAGYLSNEFKIGEKLRTILGVRA